MSQLVFQTALAMLIRLPEHNRANIEDFLSQYPLEDLEKQKLHQLAKDRELIKFGCKMRIFRIEFLLQSLNITLEHVEQEDLIDFVKWEFEPRFTSIAARSANRHFRHFLMQFKDPSYQALLLTYFKELPDYFFDLIQFELLEAELEFHGFEHQFKPKTGPLVHHKFETLALDFNIQKYVEKKRNLSLKKSATLTPKAVKTWLLFLCDDENDYGYQVFEIDELGVNFLEKSRLGQSVKKPSYYEDFVQAGLCR